MGLRRINLFCFAVNLPNFFSCSVGMCSIHGIGEVLNWLLPLLSEGLKLNFEKIEEKFLRTARNTYWFSRFQKRRKFSYFWLCPLAKLPKFEQWIWFSYICCISVTSTQRVLYLCILVTSNQRVKTVIFAEKNNFFSNVLTLNMYQTANLWTILLNFQCFFYLTNLKYLWKISLIWPICRNQKVKTVKNGGQDAFFMWHFQIH